MDPTQYGYPGYNFLQRFPLNSSGQGQMPTMGDGPILGQNFMQPQQHGHHGFNPLMMMSPLLGMFMSGHPNLGLGMISPMLGAARALGAFK